MAGHQPGPLERLLDSRERQRHAVGEHEPLRERALVRRVEVLELGDPVVEQPAAGTQQPMQSAGVDVDPLLAHVLDHADAGDRVERPVGDLAVIGHADLDPVGHAGLANPLAGQLGLMLRSVIPSTLTPCREAAWIAKLPQPQPTSSTRSPSCRASFLQTSSSLASWASSSVCAPPWK